MKISRNGPRGSRRTKGFYLWLAKQPHPADTKCCLFGGKVFEAHPMLQPRSYRVVL